MRLENGHYTQALMAEAVLKYDWDSIEHRIIATGLTQEEANMMEIDLIYYYKKVGRSLNIANGGLKKADFPKIKGKKSLDLVLSW